MTRRALVLHLLREAGPDRGVTTAELLKAGCGSRYGARLLELRQAGHVIETERVREGSYRYRLTHDAQLAGGPAAAATGSSALNDHGPALASSPPGGAPQDLPLFELPPPAPRSALLDEDAA